MDDERIRAARVAELESISDLAVRSKGHWGYSAEFLEACRDELSLNAEDLERFVVMVLERDGRIDGFYALETSAPEGELWSLSVDPPAIRTGAGSSLWGDALERAREAGVVRLRIEADPFAEGFYLAMGAVRIGEAASGSIGGRSLPLLTFAL